MRPESRDSAHHADDAPKQLEGTNINSTSESQQQSNKRPRNDELRFPPASNINVASSSSSDHNPSMSSAPISFNEIVVLLYESLTRFANSFNCSLSQLNCVTNDHSLMSQLTQKFVDAVVIFHQVASVTLFPALSNTSSDAGRWKGGEEKYHEELHRFLDQVLTCALEELIEDESDPMMAVEEVVPFRKLLVFSSAQPPEQIQQFVITRKDTSAVLSPIENK